MGRYAKGASRENQVAAFLASPEGGHYDVTRSAGSKWGKDLVAAKPGTLLYVEVKASRRGAFADFGPAERADLLGCAARAGATAVLCWAPAASPQEWRWIFPAEWP